MTPPSLGFNTINVVLFVSWRKVGFMFFFRSSATFLLPQNPPFLKEGFWGTNFCCLDFVTVFNSTIYLRDIQFSIFTNSRKQYWSKDRKKFTILNTVFKCRIGIVNFLIYIYEQRGESNELKDKGFHENKWKGTKEVGKSGEEKFTKLKKNWYGRQSKSK